MGILKDFTMDDIKCKSPNNYAETWDDLFESIEELKKYFYRACNLILLCYNTCVN